MKTLEFRDGSLWLLDQTMLPLEETTIECRQYGQVADAIRHLSVRGAPAIGLAAAYGAVLAAQSLSEAGTTRSQFDAGMEEAFGVLAATRPTAVNLFWAIERMRDVWRTHGDESAGAIAGCLLAEADEMLRADEEINRRMGRHGSSLISDGANILTHCNAGALATGAFGTALGIVFAAHEQGKRVHVWVDETRPLLQGARLTAWELHQAGIPYTLITDSMAGHFMARGRIDLAVVGADRIAANGDTANKIGTYTVATLARAHDLPLYVVAPTSTIDLATPTGGEIAIEERSADEVAGFRTLRVAPVGACVANPAFDVTPAHLITAIVTEQGITRTPFVEGLANAVSSAHAEERASAPIHRTPNGSGR